MFNAVMRTCRVVFFLCVNWTVLLILNATCCSAKDNNDADSDILAIIQSKWKSRQEFVRDSEFIMKMEKTYAKGSENLLGESPMPPRDITFTVPKVIHRLSGKKLRYDTQIINLQEIANGNEDTGVLQSSFNGQDSMQLAVRTFGDSPPQGLIPDIDKYRDARTLLYRPLMLAFRGLEPEMNGIDLNSLTVLNNKVPVGTRMCVEAKNSDTHEYFFFDWDNDFQIVKYRIGDAENLGATLDIDYKEIEGFLIPSSWKLISVNPNGSFRNSTKVTVIQHRINPGIDDGIFTLEFPPGCYVTDNKRRVKYIVRENGSKRMVTQAELRRRPSYSDLLNTETGQAALITSGNKTKSKLLIAANMVCISFLLYAIYRKRQVG